MNRSIVFARWHQCAPYLIHVPWTHASQHSKRHLDQVSRFRTANGPICYNGPLFMAALWNRPGHYIFVHGFFLSSSSFFIPRLISAAADWMSTILPRMVWPYSANSECRSDMCCTRLAGNAGPKKSPKIRHLGTIAQLSGAISSLIRHVSTIGKNMRKQ